MSKKRYLTILVVIVIVSLIVMVVYNFMNQQKETYKEFTERLNVYYSNFSKEVEKILDDESVEFRYIDVKRLKVIRQLEETENSGNIYIEKKAEEIKNLKADIDSFYDDIVNTYYLKGSTEIEIMDDEILRQKDLIDGQIEYFLNEDI